MKLFGFLFKLLIIFTSALLGNWVGEKLRYMVTGEKGHELELFQSTPEGELMVAVNPVWTNVLPAFGFALLGRPRWWYSFLGGAAASFIMGNEYEEEFLSFIEEASGRQEQVGF
jgi:hypothetical protein